MIKIEKIDVMNIENAIRGARNPMNSWNKMDSYVGYDEWDQNKFVMGENDLGLARRLCKAGSDHRKFLRQIFVSVDITAPLYWWKEYDTYKVGTTANSTSTMHKIHARPITIEDFSFDNGLDVFQTKEEMQELVNTYEHIRLNYAESKNKDIWRMLIQLLPSSYNQLRTCTLTYENLVNMYFSRRKHKLNEWREFCEVIENLPYMKDILAAVESGRMTE